MTAVSNGSSNKNIFVQKSRIHGRGVFAKKDFNPGDFICYIKGERHFKVNKDIKDALANPDWVGIGHNIWIDPIPPYKFLNHSCDSSGSIKGAVTIVARKRIKKGDEVTLDYSLIEEDPLWEMRCSCGVKDCRKIVRSIRFLPQGIFKKYLPLVPTYFQGVYKKTGR